MFFLRNISLLPEMYLLDINKEWSIDGKLSQLFLKMSLFHFYSKNIILLSYSTFKDITPFLPASTIVLEKSSVSVLIICKQFVFSLHLTLRYLL